MKNEKMKPTFEPVSVEEAKKIRASGNKDDRQDSGITRCESGIQDKWAACWLKTDNDPCCYWDGGQEKRVICINTNFSTIEPPSTLLYMMCKTEPWEGNK